MKELLSFSVQREVLKDVNNHTRKWTEPLGKMYSIKKVSIKPRNRMKIKKKEN